VGNVISFLQVNQKEAISMFGQGGKLSLKTVDDEIIAKVEEGISKVEEFAGELPLVGISVQAMHDIEKKGLELIASRQAEIKAEIARLSTELAGTEALLVAGTTKLKSLVAFLKPVAQAPDKPEVPAAVHTDIQTDRPKAEPVIADIQA
jgi:hypothetical protein